MRHWLFLFFVLILTPLAADIGITAEAVAVEPGALEKFMGFVTEYQQIIGMLIPLLLAIFEIVRERKSWRNSLALLAQTLQDENKMENGKYFTAEAIKKLEEIAAVTGAAKAEIEVTKEILSNVNRNGIKVGTYNGKPVYLQDAVVVGGMVRNAWRALRGLFRR